MGKESNNVRREETFPTEEPPEPRVITKELIKADVVDSNGDLFPRATLADMVKETMAKLLANKDLWATEGFRGDTASIQGRVVGVSMNMEQNAIEAEVEMYPTPMGTAVLDVMDKAGEDAFEMALAGRVDQKDITVEERDGHEIRVIHKAELTGVAFVTKGTKIK
jgi:hypothetical protein